MKLELTVRSSFLELELTLIDGCDTATAKSVQVLTEQKEKYICTRCASSRLYTRCGTCKIQRELGYLNILLNEILG